MASSGLAYARLSEQLEQLKQERAVLETQIHARLVVKQQVRASTELERLLVQLRALSHGLYRTTKARHTP